MTPVCINQCSKKPCKCFWLYKKHSEAQIAEQHPGEEIEVEHYWQIKKTTQSVPNHYDGCDEPRHNRTAFIFPVKNDPILSQKFNEKLQGNLEIPSQVIPMFNAELKCKHNNIFNDNDDALFPISKKTTIYSAMSETTTDSIIIYGRRSKMCKCVQQPDTHDLLLWNLGAGRLMEYEYLFSALHQWYAGQPFSNQVSARKSFFDNLSRWSTLTSNDLDRAVTGLAKCMKIDKGVLNFKDYY